MRHAETVTFGGSGLDRAAAQRGDDALAQLLASHEARALLLWRGKPLMSVSDRMSAWLAMDNPLVVGAQTPPVFLGLDDGRPRFAVDFSEWEPGDAPEFADTFLDKSEQHHPDLPDDWVFSELRANMAFLTPRDAELLATAKAILGWHASHGFCAKCGAKTEQIEAGWQRKCDECGTRHFPRTDPVVIMLITHGNSVLVGRSPHWPEGMYSLLAGFVEPGETLEAAVRREVMEETGVTVGPVEYLASQSWPFPSSLMVGCAGEATTTAIELDPVELDDAIWISREDMLDVFAGRHPDLYAARKGSIARFLIENWLADRLD